MEKLLNANQVADYLNCSPKSVYSWARSGVMPSYKINGLLRFKSTEIEALLNSSKVNAEPIIDIKPKSTNRDEVDEIIKRTIASFRS
jgi:excisionase family DNA binding protein